MAKESIQTAVFTVTMSGPQVGKMAEDIRDDIARAVEGFVTESGYGETLDSVTMAKRDGNPADNGVAEIEALIDAVGKAQAGAFSYGAAWYALAAAKHELDAAYGHAVNGH